MEMQYLLIRIATTIRLISYCKHTEINTQQLFTTKTFKIANKANHRSSRRTPFLIRNKLIHKILNLRIITLLNKSAIRMDLQAALTVKTKQ